MYNRHKTDIDKYEEDFEKMIKRANIDYGLKPRGSDNRGYGFDSPFDVIRPLKEILASAGEEEPRRRLGAIPGHSAVSVV